jgi:hypothetical protein
MTDERPSTLKLSPRDRAILNHVARYRLSTPEVIHRLYFGDLATNAVTKVTLRLRRAGYLVAHELYHKHIYFLPGPMVDRGNPKAGEPFGTQKLILTYGTLAFCCTGETVQRLLTPAEFEEVRGMLSLSPALPYHNFFLDKTEGHTRINWIRIDYGAEQRRLLRLVWTKLDAWMGYDGFPALIKAGRFAVTLVTTGEPKRRSLQASYDRNPIEGVPLRVAVVPELLDLIARQTPRAPQSDTKPTEADDEL